MMMIEDDDDDEGPFRWIQTGVTKRRRFDSAAFWVCLQLLRKLMTKAQRRNQDSDPEYGNILNNLQMTFMQDDGNVSDMEDTDNAHIPKVSTTTWFKPIPESERPATPELEWTIPPNDFPNQNTTGQMAIRTTSSMQHCLKPVTQKLRLFFSTDGADYYFNEDYTIVLCKEQQLLQRQKTINEKLLRCITIIRAGDKEWSEDDKRRRKTSSQLIVERLQFRMDILKMEMEMEIPSSGDVKVTGSTPIKRGLIQAIPTSLPPQPIGEATKAANL
ncbi:hypothetical protein Tco_0341058 [Tanacetum coccineum]